TLVAYTWSKSTDIGSGYFNVENGPGGGSTIQNYYDPNTARGVSSYDISHFLSWATGYELPFGKTKRWAQNGLASWIAGGWQANYIMQARTGQPYTLQIVGELANLRGSAPAAPGNYLRPKDIAAPFTPAPRAGRARLRQIPIHSARKQFHKVDAPRMQCILLRAGLIRARLVFHRVRLETLAAMCFAARRFSIPTFLCSKVFPSRKV